jgi:hypothetical protein
VTRDRWSSSCRAKIARADEHLAQLNRETDAWGDSDPFEITRECNAAGSEHVFTLHFKTQPDVWHWAVLLGDALHNLRGALDHIVYALAAAQTGIDPPDDETRLAFPICSEPKYFDGQRNRIKSLSAPTQGAIEKLQPYNRLKPGKWFAPLWWLAQLNDADKHRLAHIAVLAGRANEIATDAPQGTYRALWYNGPLADGVPLFRLLLKNPDPNVYVDLHCAGAVVLDAEGFPPSSVYWVTRHIRREVVVACRYLAGFLPG